MPVVARIVRRSLLTAIETHVEVPTELGRAAALDGVEHGPLAAGEGVRSLVGRTVSSHDIRQLQPRPVTLRRTRRASAGLVTAHDELVS